MKETPNDGWERYRRELSTLYQLHYRLLYRIAYRVLHNKSDVEEILQNLFLGLSDREAPEPDFFRNARAYLCQSAKNNAVKMAQSKALREPINEPMPVFDMRGSDRPYREEDLQRMRTALSRMDPDVVMALSLRHQEECDCAEIARIMEKPITTIWAMLYRGRKQVRQLMGIKEKNDGTQKKKHAADDGAAPADPSEA